MPFSGPTGGAAAAVEIKIRQDWLGMRLERTVQNQGLRYSDQFPLIVYTAPLSACLIQEDLCSRALLIVLWLLPRKQQKPPSNQPNSDHSWSTAAAAVEV